MKFKLLAIRKNYFIIIIISLFKSTIFQQLSTAVVQYKYSTFIVKHRKKNSTYLNLCLPIFFVTLDCTQETIPVERNIVNINTISKFHRLLLLKFHRTKAFTTGNLSGILLINDNFFKFHNSNFPSFFTITKYCLETNSNNYIKYNITKTILVT